MYYINRTLDAPARPTVYVVPARVFLWTRFCEGWDRLAQQIAAERDASIGSAPTFWQRVRERFAFLFGSRVPTAKVRR